MVRGGRSGAGLPALPTVAASVHSLHSASVEHLRIGRVHGEGVDRKGFQAMVNRRPGLPAIDAAQKVVTPTARVDLFFIVRINKDAKDSDRPSISVAQRQVAPPSSLTVDPDRGPGKIVARRVSGPDPGRTPCPSRR